MTLRIIGLLLSALLTTLTVHGCSCHDLGEFTQEEYNELGVIFTGQVVDEYYDTISDRTIIKFKVDQIFKGQSENGYIYAVNSPSSCRIQVKKGEHFLLFLYGKVGHSEISICSRKIRIDAIDSFIPPSGLLNVLTNQMVSIKAIIPAKN